MTTEHNLQVTSGEGTAVVTITSISGEEITANMIREAIEARTDLEVDNTGGAAGETLR